MQKACQNSKNIKINNKMLLYWYIIANEIMKKNILPKEKQLEWCKFEFFSVIFPEKNKKNPNKK